MREKGQENGQDYGGLTDRVARQISGDSLATAADVVDALRGLVEAIDTYGDQRTQYWPETVVAVNLLTRLDRPATRASADSEATGTQASEATYIPDVDEIAALPTPKVEDSVVEVGGERTMDWQPIETAPFDTPLIVRDTHGLVYTGSRCTGFEDRWQEAINDQCLWFWIYAPAPPDRCPACANGQTTPDDMCEDCPDAATQQGASA